MSTEESSSGVVASRSNDDENKEHNDGDEKILDNQSDINSPTVTNFKSNPSISTTTTSSDKPSVPGSSNPLTKIEIIFKAVGDAPILKQSKWAVPMSKTVGWVNGNIRKYLKLEPSESLFIYVRQSFAPSLDQTIENLYNCFGSGDGKLIVHYSKTQAWG